MKLHEHPDFAQAVIRAAEHFRARGMRPAIIEKDYYVTEALRAIATAGGNRVIFKGGTSLSKGWSIIERFSEDIDLFLDPEASTPPLGTKGIDKGLKRLRDAVVEGVPVRFLKDESRTFGGLGRHDRFAYDARFAGPGEVAPRVLLESGIASGREPTETISLGSYLAEFLAAVGTSLGAEDEARFPMRLLHFRRTFVEKLFAIHKKVELFKRDGTPVGGHARHYYDLAQLARRSEIPAMLRSDEYDLILADYDRVSRAFFPQHYFKPKDMRFRHSEAIFPRADLSAALAKDYETQCAQLCFGRFPTWNEVRATFESMRDIL